jgi:uncharacterized protein YcbX
MKIEALYTYPIKALRAQSLDTATCTKHGFAYERRFMLLEEKLDPSTNEKTYRNMHVAHDPLGTVFFPTLHPPSSSTAKDGSIKVVFSPPKDSSKEESTLEIPLEPETQDLEEVEITMHQSPTKAYRMPSKYNDWFSSCFGYTVILAYLGSNYRPVLMSTSTQPTPPPSTTTTNNGSSWLSTLSSTAQSYLPSLSSLSPQSPNQNQKEITFSDCAPYLVVSSTSLTPLSSRLPEGSQADITKFRPNIVVSGAAEPWEEDFWAEIAVGGNDGDSNSNDGPQSSVPRSSAPRSSAVGFTAAHNCARCKSLNIDYDTGAPGKGGEGRLLAVMQRDRRVDEGMKWSPVFGRYCFLTEEDDLEGKEKVVRVGDEVLVGRRNGGRTRFGEYSCPEHFFLLWFGTVANVWDCLCRLEGSCYCLDVRAGADTQKSYNPNVDTSNPVATQNDLSHILITRHNFQA